MEYDVGREWKENDCDVYEVCVVDFEYAFHLITIKEEGRGAMVARSHGLDGVPQALLRHGRRSVDPVPGGGVACRLGQARFQPE
eukprot:9249230-Lingulodinium_polyedra.AAC.1